MPMTTEDKFHLWAFHTAYDMQSETTDPRVRFVRALALSYGAPSPGIIDNWKKAEHALTVLRREWGSKKRTADYWRAAFAAIAEYTGVKVVLRAWEADRIGDEVIDKDAGAASPNNERLAKERAEREVAGKCPPCPSRTT